MIFRNIVYHSLITFEIYLFVDNFLAQTHFSWTLYQIVVFSTFHFKPLFALMAQQRQKKPLSRVRMTTRLSMVTCRRFEPVNEITQPHVYILVIFRISITC